MLQQFTNYINEEGLIKPKNKILLAISGGLDSVVLAHLFKKSSLYIEFAHVNFQLRGDESNRDEAFVRTLATSLNVPLHVKHVDTEGFATEHKLSIQEAARKIRYDWFHLLLTEQKLDLIATAHHADDNVETMLMNLFRGTGLAGMRGILPKQGKIIRPLLFSSRAQIEQFAQENNISHVEDSSNASDKYTRNFLRIHLIPQLTSVWPEAAENLRDNLTRFRESEQLYKESLDRRLKKLVIDKGDDIHIPVEGLRFAGPVKTLLFEIFHPKGFSSRQMDEIFRLMNADTGSYIDSSSHRIIKNRNWFICTPLHKDRPNLIIIDKKDSEVNTTAGLLTLRKQNVSIIENTSPDRSSATLDSGKIEFPLILRPWKPGDYFYPLGMSKKKKVARFLIDQKIPKHEKEQVLVLESAGRICWVLGLRIDDRFKVIPSTLDCIHIKIS